MDIIVCEEKHSTRYYDASTLEAWAKSSLKILTERFRAGYWYYDPRESLRLRRERDDVLAMTDEAIEALPETVRKGVIAKRNSARARQAEDDEAADQYDRIKAVVEAQDLGFVKIGRGRWEREEPKAWRLLDERSDHEYEHVEVVKVDS